MYIKFCYSELSWKVFFVDEHGCQPQRETLETACETEQAARGREQTVPAVEPCPDIMGPDSLLLWLLVFPILAGILQQMRWEEDRSVKMKFETRLKICLSAMLMACGSNSHSKSVPSSIQSGCIPRCKIGMNSSRWKTQLWTDQMGCESDSWLFLS